MQCVSRYVCIEYSETTKHLLRRLDYVSCRSLLDPTSSCRLLLYYDIVQQAELTPWRIKNGYAHLAQRFLLFQHSRSHHAEGCWSHELPEQYLRTVVITDSAEEGEGA